LKRGRGEGNRVEKGYKDGQEYGQEKMLNAICNAGCPNGDGDRNGIDRKEG
jgi:hypothetical protein